jgi:hypothetical protein
LITSSLLGLPQGNRRDNDTHKTHTYIMLSNLSSQMNEEGVSLREKEHTQRNNNKATGDVNDSLSFRVCVSFPLISCDLVYFELSIRDVAIFRGFRTQDSFPFFLGS